MHGPRSVDLIVARACVEHLHDTAAFLRLAYEALEPGGKLICTFPNKWATFAIINRAIPRAFARFLLKHLFPGSEGRLGFPAYYDLCTPRQFASSARDAGFQVEREFESYFASVYFAGVLPLYVLALATDYIRHISQLPALSCTITFVLAKPIQRE
jgi:SAM-dependent methyltransferase